MTEFKILPPEPPPSLWHLTRVEATGPLVVELSDQHGNTARATMEFGELVRWDWFERACKNAGLPGRLSGPPDEERKPLAAQAWWDGQLAQRLQHLPAPPAPEPERKGGLLSGLLGSKEPSDWRP